MYCYGLPLTGNRSGFHKLVQVETGSVAESPVLEEQPDRLLQDLSLDIVTTDDSFTPASRIRQWAKQGVVLLMPTLKWVQGRYATPYHTIYGFIKQPENADLFHSRRTAIEPVFDLVAKVLGTTARQKQLPLE